MVPFPPFRPTRDPYRRGLQPPPRSPLLLPRLLAYPSPGRPALNGRARHLPAIEGFPHGFQGFPRIVFGRGERSELGHGHGLGNRPDVMFLREPHQNVFLLFPTNPSLPLSNFSQPLPQKPLLFLVRVHLFLVRMHGLLFHCPPHVRAYSILYVNVPQLFASVRGRRGSLVSLLFGNRLPELYAGDPRDRRCHRDLVGTPPWEIVRVGRFR